MDKQPEDDKYQKKMDQVIAEALDNLKVYVEAGKEEAFIQIKPPQLTRFQLPVATDKDQMDSQFLMHRECVEATAVDRWTRNEVLEVDLINPEDVQHFGKRLTDELTGQSYMLLPIELDILIDPNNLTPDSEEPFHNDLHKKEEESQHCQELENQCRRNVFKIPKLNLNFELILAPEPAEAKDS